MRQAAAAAALLAALCHVLAALCQAAAANSYCTPVNSTKGVQLPVIPESYQTRIEMNVVTKGKTYEIEEFLDGVTGNRRVRMFQKNGEIDDYIFVNGTGQIYVVINNIYCLVVNRSLTDIDLLLGINGKVVGSASQVLRFAKEFGLEYRNRSVVRGVQVDYWYSCQEWKERKAEFEVNWYFSASDWRTPYNRNLPVRAEVKGEAGEIGSTRRSFHIIYDFMFFRDSILASDRIFQTPNGVHCENRVQLRKPPLLPEVMSYSQEVLIYNPQLQLVRYGEVVYDSAQQLVKYQYREPTMLLRPPFYSGGSMTVIQDFSTGVSYFIDDLIGNCTDRPIGADAFDVQSPGPGNTAPGWHIVEMRSPPELFRIDDSYQFTGSRTTRGMPVDRFISARHDFKVQGREDLNFTFEYRFLDPRVSELVVGKNKISEGRNIPVQLRISNYKKMEQGNDPTFDYREEYNFYNFDTQLGPDASVDFDRVQPYDLDVIRCYAKEERKNVMISFLNDDLYEKYIQDKEYLFIRRATEALTATNFGLMNPIRVQRVRLDHDNMYIYFVFTMLAGPHPYAQFHRLSGRNRYVERADHMHAAKSELECLQRCNSVSNPICNSAAYCPGSSTGYSCLLSQSFDTGTQNPDPSHQCAVFMRPTLVKRPGSTELSLESAFSLLVEGVKDGLLKVRMERSRGNDIEFVNVTAVDVEQFDVRPNVDQALVSRFLYKFTMEPGAGMQKTQKPLDKVSIDQCAEACLGSSQFDCKSFTFCYGLGLCLLHTESPSESPEQKEQRGRCNLYDRNELSMFTKEAGVSRVEGAHNDLVLAADARSCARSCAGRQQCRSFDFCDLGEGLQKLCYLSASHRLDGLGNGTLKVNCTHYSKAYTSDFHLDFEVKQPDLSAYPASFDGLNLDACSRQCAERFGDRCNGFYFCRPAGDKQSQCLVHEPGLPKVTAPGAGSLPVCAYYRREYELNGKVWVQRSTGIVPGAAAGGVSALNVLLVALVLCIVGAVVGGGLVLAFMRLRAGQPAQSAEESVQYQR